MDEIAGFVSYLASPEAAYITGANLLADGRFAAEPPTQPITTVTSSSTNSNGALRHEANTTPTRKILPEDWAALEEAFILTPSGMGIFLLAVPFC